MSSRGLTTGSRAKHENLAFWIPRSSRGMTVVFLRLDLSAIN
ncbi:MAG: palindromic element RPE4 domain-containing protein [Alphaproteobacteria bacterium]|nr:MAG: palindromic element RPE4 domain-containing protein [Alphaproteobacteria bacterium]